LVYFAHNEVPPEKIKEVISNIRDALARPHTDPKPVPSVPLEDSIHDDYIVCLEDGKHMQVLKRYLWQSHGMSPKEYRSKWGLPDDYPMVCKPYSERRV